MRTTGDTSRLAIAARAALIVLAAGCATSGGSGSQPMMRQEHIQIDGVNSLTLWRDESLSSDEVALGQGVAWPALLRAYASFGAPLEGSDPKNHVIATQLFRAHGTFAGKQMSTWLDCGSSITGDIANGYEITMRIGTRLDSLDAGRTKLSSAVSARASSIGSSSPPVHCTSRRTLEKYLAEMVSKG